MMEVKNDKNRWEIKKIGLLNYWWYDEEEFEFADGRLILRGTNGSGKSVTMQSFIPLLLDGNKSPERLDPFNTKARKIEDYILGYGDDIKEENTSYLYMEFCKKETKNYLTIGMGLRAKKNNGVKFWGFIIKDGRRIGKDIFLYKDIGNKIPLTKQELKNRIGDGGQVVETTAEYANLVNENIFGFESSMEYQEFIKLLIEIRTPKLSKDGFKPSIITEIMSNSLRGLSDDDLKAVSESIENMNKTREQLEMLGISNKALKQIIVPYDNYNKRVLYDKAKKYDITQKKYIKTQKEEKEIVEKIQNLNKTLQEKEDRRQDIEKEIQVYKFKKEELKSNELWQQKQKQAEMEKEIEGLEHEIKQKEKMSEDKKIAITKREEEKKKAKERCEINKDKFETIKNEMEQIARTINYDEYFFMIDVIALDKRCNYHNFQEDIKRYITKIEDGKKALEKEKLAENEYENALENLDKEKQERTKQEGITTKSRNELEENKEIFIENVYKWEKLNEILKLEDKELTEISQKVQNYGENIEYGDIQYALNEPYNNKKQEILNIKANKNAEKEGIVTQINQVKKELEEWKNQKDPEPQRSKRVEENRKKLKEKNIPFVEFYNAVDFKKELDERERGNLEAALLDMGILDALIIPKEYIEKIKQIDIDFVDKYLFEKPLEFKHDLTQSLEVKISQTTKVKEETVYNVLKSIMLEDKNSDTYVNEKGEYKIGLLYGMADKNEKAKFIGLEAKKEYKKKIIEELEEQKEELESKIEKLDIEIQELNKKLNKIEEEYKGFPSKKDLEMAYSNLRSNIITLDTIKKNVEKLENVLANKLEILKQAKEETKIKTTKLSFNLTLEVYTENLELAKAFKDFLYDMEKQHNEIVNENEKIMTITDILEGLADDLDEILYEMGKKNNTLRTLKEKVQSIKQMLSSDMDEIEKQMEECIEKLDKLPKEKEKTVIDITRIKSDLERQQEINININAMLNNLEKQTDLAREIYKQELDLKYVIEEYEEINKSAQKVLSEYSYFEKDPKTKSNYYENLVEKFQNNNENLLDYNLSLVQILVKEIESQENDIKELEQTRIRNDITCFVNGKKVDLKYLNKYIEETMEETRNLVDDEDRHLFEEILIGAVGRKIRERIYAAKSWVESMNKLMKSLNTSSGLSFSLNWKPKLATSEDEMDIREIVDILNSEAGLLKSSDIKKVATHFRTKFAKAEKEFKEKGEIVPFYNIIKDELDYRKWFEFQFMHKKTNEQSKELTNNAFFKLSGGEKAMAMYIPLFASVCARYQSARKDCLRIISLDEAFAGVDDNNIRDMFRILNELDLEYVINSQVLWGEYDTVPSLSICELISDVNQKIVSVMRYHWNGKKRVLVDDF